MNTNRVSADFQFMGSRVSRLLLETRILEEKGHAALSYDIDYDHEIEELNDKYIGVLRLKINCKARVKNKVLFKIDLEMEGAFVANSEKIDRDRFVEMLEMNGMVTLLNISRAYIVSISAQSGINPPVRLPMINLHKLREERKKQDKQSAE